MERFKVESLGLDDNRYMVKDTVKGWFIVANNEREANFIRDRLFEVLEE